MTRRKIGCFLMIAGLVIFLFLVAAIFSRNLYVWQNNIDGFAKKYASLADLIYSREKGAFLISAVAGFIPSCIGFFLYRKKIHA